jgi:hypothetical protein
VTRVEVDPLAGRGSDEDNPLLADRALGSGI